MSVSAEQITIAVTVFNRRKYVKHAVASALNQTAPVRVMVVEDCGPDPGLQDFVRQEFGTRIQYRNPRRRGHKGLNYLSVLTHNLVPSVMHSTVPFLSVR